MNFAISSLTNPSLRGSSGAKAARLTALVIATLRQNGKAERSDAEAVDQAAFDYNTWRMPSLASLPPAKLSLAAKAWMGILRLYLVVAGGLVLVRIVSLAIRGG